GGLLDPCANVAAVMEESDLTLASAWGRTVILRDLTGDSSIPFQETDDLFRQIWGRNSPDFDARLATCYSFHPWTVIFSGAAENSNDFQRTGMSVVLPLRRETYDAIATGKRDFDDIGLGDLQFPSSHVYLYFAFESPDETSSEATRHSLSAFMFQIAALTTEGTVYAMAPAPIHRSEMRLTRAGFTRVHDCQTEHRTFGIWERKSDRSQRLILSVLRSILRETGFLETPPMQTAVTSETCEAPD
ncbi:MAG: hypothetical protein KDA96_27600, partial [Planctomycetaceae bacterium]|nr:hypothetical protein [Planctomycetaceae bacterium]